MALDEARNPFDRLYQATEPMADAPPADVQASPTPHPAVGPADTPAAPLPGAAPTVSPQIVASDAASPAEGANPFDTLGHDVAPGTSAFGAGLHEAERGVLPTIAGAGAFGPGAAGGAALGAFGGPLAPITVPAGALAGGLIASTGAGFAVSKGQEIALSKLPDSWQEAAGQDEATREAEARQHPGAVMLGGLLPMAALARPGGFTRGALPENATALQRLMANPVTARMFGGTLMGAMELGQEKAQGDPVDWRHVAMATAFGTVFNKPTRIGETIESWGGRLGRGAPSEVAPAADAPAAEQQGGTDQQPAAPQTVGTPPPEPGMLRFFHGSLGGEDPASGGPRWVAPSAAYARDFRSNGTPKTVHYFDATPEEVTPHGGWDETNGYPQNFEAPEHLAGRLQPYTFPPTLAEAGDLKVMGPGITEDVFRGDHVQEPQSAMAAQNAARTEADVIGPPVPGPDPHVIARRLDPETFTAYDELVAQRDTFRARLADAANPPDEAMQEAAGRRDALQQQLDAVPTTGAGRNLSEARRLRAQARDAQRAVDELQARRTAYAEGRAVDTPEMAALRQQLQAVDYQMRDLSPAVASAYRLAEEHAASGSVPAVPHPADPAVPAPAPGQFASMAEMLAARDQPGTRSTAADPAAAASQPAAAPPSQVQAEQPVRAAPDPLPLTAADIERQREFIAADVARQLIAAGRPEAEARANGRLNAAYYVTRAAKMGGALGTPEELYRRTSPAMVGPDGRRIPGPAGRAGDGPAMRPPATTRPAAPLTPTLDQPAIGRDATPAAAVASDEAAAVPTSAPSAATPKPVGAPAGGIEALDPREIGVDAARFQFKAGGDARGVTERLQGVTTWDPRLAGTALVFRDAEGKNWVADGHQRVGLAQRLAAAGQEGIRVNSFVLDARDGITDADARTIAAAKNIAEGTGTAIDAAKVIREARETGRELPPLPPRSTLVRDGRALANLGPDAFGMAVNEVVPTNQAAMVGRLMTDPLQQAEAMRVLSELKPENARQAEMVVREVAATGTEEMTRQGGLFGEEHFASSIVLERAKIADEALKQLRRDRATFRTLVAEAERIEGAGANALDRGANEERLSTDERAEDLFSSLATHAGPVSDALSDVARRLKSGDLSRAAAGREFVGALRRHLAEALADGADARGVGLGAAGEREGQPLAGSDAARELTQPGAGGVDPDQTTLFQPRGTAAEVAQGLLDATEHAATRDGRGPTPPEAMATLLQGNADRANGQIRLSPGRRSVISLFGTANASTFVHESAHDWLENLMADAAHPAAPDDLRADARTARDWLGNDGRALKVKEHERFARGFEQYLREGVAPSAELAGVFARFRDWLTTIYRTLKGLGPEISPDVRAVFDRLLSTEPQRTVLAPEREGGPSLADVHEGDAAAVEPTEAAGAADRAETESARALIEAHPEHLSEVEAARTRITAAREAEQGPDVTGAAGAQPAGQAGEVAEGRDGLGGDRGGPEPVAGRGGAGDTADAEREGGRGDAAEGDKLRGSERGGAAAGDDGAGSRAAFPDKPLAPGSAPRFRPEQPRFVDRAGNIRLDTLTTSDDVRQAIRDAAAENQDFIGERGGRVTDGQVMDLAEAAGLPGAMNIVAKRVQGQAFNAVEVMTLRKALVQSAQGLSDAARATKDGDPQSLLAFAEAKARHQLLQGTVAQATAEAGRALRAFRDITMSGEAKSADLFAREATGKTLFQLKREAALMATFDTPDKLSKFTADTNRSSAGRLLMEMYVNGLISGPVTHTTYAIGNTILTANRMLIELPTAAAVGALRRGLGGEGGVRMGEVGAQLRGAAGGLAPAAQSMVDAYRTGATTLLPGEGGPAFLPFAGHDFTPAAGLDEHATLFSVMQGLKDGVLAAGGIAKASASDLVTGARGGPLLGLQRDPAAGYWPNVTVRGVTVLPVGDVIRFPGRNVAAIHSFFRAMNYSIDKAGIAYRTAANEGLTGEQLAARVADIHANPTDAVMEQARSTATNLTLMGQGGEFVKRLSALLNWTPDVPGIGPVQPLRFVDPFVKISGNVMGQALMERTPIGAALSPEIRASLAGKNGPAAQDLAIGRMIAGTALATTFGLLAKQGLVTGSGPQGNDEQETRHLQSMWRLAGNQAHSVRVGDLWYDVHRLGPLGVLMGVAADLSEIGSYASDGDLGKAGGAVMHAFTQNILDESFVKGPADLIEAVQDPARYGPSYIRNQLAGFVPYSTALAQMARASDPYSREARSVLDTIKAKIPGMSESLLPKRDIWGNPVPSRDAVGGPYATAIYVQRANADPVAQAMLDAGIYPAPVNRRIVGQQLTDQQYDDFARIAGGLLHNRLSAMVRSPDWRLYSRPDQQQSIEEQVKATRNTAAEMVKLKYPSIPAAAVLAERKKLTEGRP